MSISIYLPTLQSTFFYIAYILTLTEGLTHRQVMHINAKGRTNLILGRFLVNRKQIMQESLTSGVVFDAVNVLWTGSLNYPSRVASWPASSDFIRGGVTIETLEENTTGVD